jgi:HK97 family phage prohead protease
MEKEIRTFNPTDCEIRATRRGRTIEGYGIVFNKESKDLGGFVEIIDPKACDEILQRSDVLALLNHNEERGVLARCTNGEGTMELEVDSKGVKYRFDAPDTALGDEVLSGIRRGDIRTSSFAFSVTKEGQKWEKRSDGTDLRRIMKFSSIYDMSPVYREAYADTSVAVRSLVEMRTEEQAKHIADLEEELRKKNIPPSESTEVVIEPEKDLTEYFKEIDLRIKKM